jgi:hypothetical protein
MNDDGQIDRMLVNKEDDATLTYKICTESYETPF